MAAEVLPNSRPVAAVHQIVLPIRAPELDDSQLDEVYKWVDNMPLSRVKRNMSRDFSDGVLMSEITKIAMPKLTNFQNYGPANSIARKKENWDGLNERVFRKMGFLLHSDDIDGIVNGKPLAIERVVYLFKEQLAAYLSGDSQAIAKPTASSVTRKSVQEALKRASQTPLLSSKDLNDLKTPQTPLRKSTTVAKAKESVKVNGEVAKGQTRGTKEEATKPSAAFLSTPRRSFDSVPKTVKTPAMAPLSLNVSSARHVKLRPPIPTVPHPKKASAPPSADETKDVAPSTARQRAAKKAEEKNENIEKLGEKKTTVDSKAKATAKTVNKDSKAKAKDKRTATVGKDKNDSARVEEKAEEPVVLNISSLEEEAEVVNEAGSTKVESEEASGYSETQDPKAEKESVDVETNPVEAEELESEELPLDYVNGVYDDTKLENASGEVDKDELVASETVSQSKVSRSHAGEQESLKVN